MVQCYYKNQDQVIRQINSGLCLGSQGEAGHYSCCFPWDKCLPDGICFDPKQTTYYTSLCTDQTLQDSSCQKGCGRILCPPGRLTANQVLMTVFRRCLPDQPVLQYQQQFMGLLWCQDGVLNLHQPDAGCARPGRTQTQYENHS